MGAAEPPETIDVAIGQLAQMLFDVPDDPTPGQDLLDEVRMDFSVESLQELDDYLERVRRRFLSQPEKWVVIMRAGAYLGEVIRQQSGTKHYHWYDDQSAGRLDRRLRSRSTKDVGLVAILWDGAGTVVLPLRRVERFLQHGRAFETRSFASSLIAGEPPEREPASEVLRTASRDIRRR
jgi:hypothetical protein